MEYSPELRLEWVEGFDLLCGHPTYLPLNAVVFPYEPPAGRPVLYDSGTNGLASGNTLEEALCHALCEVIERDASAVSDACTDLAPAVSRALKQMGLASPDANLPADTCFPLIELKSLPRRAKVLVQRLQRAGIAVYLRDITSTAGIATFDCVIVDRGLGGPRLAAGGTGTHPDARVAVTRALTEAAQSLGASGFRILFNVILPNVRSAVLSGAFLTFAIVIGEFTFASLLARPVFGTYLQEIGANQPYEPSALALIAFFITWACMGLIQIVGRSRGAAPAR